MRILFAPDSFKGSLSSKRVSEIMRRAFQEVDAQVEAVLKPMADGGEGTLEALAKATEHEKVTFDCTGPLGEKSKSWYLALDETRAVIEGANIAGLPLVPSGKRNPDHTTTYGIGEAIQHALDRGHRDLMIAIGGSSTNDGGLGMLQALGMKTLDNNSQQVGKFGKDVANIEHIDLSSIDPRLAETTIRIASDVDNPLTGPRGASHIYARQKGATKEQIVSYDQSLHTYGKLIEETIGQSLMDYPGSGAAGGLGFAFLAIGAKLESGAKLVAEAIQLREAVQNADYVITGEGQSDEQTLYGKAPGHVAELAQHFGKPALLLSGGIDGEFEQLNQLFTSCFSIVPGPKSLEECLENAEDYLFQATKQVARLILN
ncbi:glycerate kinase [Halobacillus sp. H74]|uniref:glycerate kinase n=1 Tax=Halobacillus sp. H74 TaxID=3457436 RepID=UPI003FCC9C0E